MQLKVHRGGCLCGWIRFEAEGNPERPHTCSCGMCRRHTGAPAAAWVEYPRDRVRWVGPGGPPSTFRSSDYSSRAFCSRCGSSIGAIDDEPTVALLVGGMDEINDKALAPEYHSFEDALPEWWSAQGACRNAG